MADPVTVNRGFAIPNTGADVGVWGPVINGDFNQIDTIVGGIASISTTGGTITLSAAQLACGTISISGALISGVGIIFPNVQGWWSIENLTTGNSTVTVYTPGYTERIFVPPGEITDIQVNNTITRFRNLGRIGGYLDYAGASVPAWITSCTIPPYLNCDGSTFSAVIFPQLANILGTTTLPDLRGRSRAYLNQGTGRITSGGSGINGDALSAGGGAQSTSLGTANMASYTPTGTVNDGRIFGGTLVNGVGIGLSGAAGGTGSPPLIAQGSGSTATIGIVVTNGGSITFAGNNNGGVSQSFSLMGPTAIGGITMIRAA